MQTDPQHAETEMNLARQALGHGDPREAHAICTRLLQKHPKYAPALHMSSLLLFREGHVLTALESMTKAIELEPKRADWLNDLGNLLAASKQYEQAVKFFQHALLQTPNNAVIWNNLGAMRVKLNQPDLAGEAFEQAIALDDSLVDAWANYANWLTEQGREQDAAECVLRAFVAASPEGQSLVLRGMALVRLGRQAEAAACFQAHLKKFPNDPTASHLFHACAGDTIPERASDDYIRVKYDDFAYNYDTTQSEMSYRGPDLIAAVVDSSCKTGLDVLDAGCGTGLVAREIAAHCATLTGVDLSGKMLEEAARTGLYQSLEQQEITHYLASERARFDLITAADLLIYFGPLDAFCHQAYQALRADGHLIATFEAQPERAEDFVLQTNGRYCHSEHYLTHCLGKAGFDSVGISLEQLRTENGHEIPCWLVMAHKPAEG
jgi:predicted TPR repeat methyltransferase